MAIKVVKYKCPVCGTEEEENYQKHEVLRPRIHLCWFCSIIRGNSSIMEEVIPCQNPPTLKKEYIPTEKT